MVTESTGQLRLPPERGKASQVPQVPARTASQGKGSAGHEVPSAIVMGGVDRFMFPVVASATPNVLKALATHLSTQQVHGAGLFPGTSIPAEGIHPTWRGMYS